MRVYYTTAVNPSDREIGQHTGQRVGGKDHPSVFRQAGLQMGPVGFAAPELRESGGSLLRSGGQRKPPPLFPPQQGGIRPGLGQGPGPSSQVFQLIKGDPAPGLTADMGKHQHPAGFRVGLDFNGALQVNTLLTKSGSGQLQGLLQGQLRRRQAVFFQVGGGDVQGNAGAADGLDGHRLPPLKCRNHYTRPQARRIAVMIGGIGKAEGGTETGIMI